MKKIYQKMFIKIMLDCSDKVCPGTTIYGRVQFMFTLNQHVKEIKVVLRGLELIRTNTTAGKNSFNSYRDFLNTKITLVEKGNIKAGKYEYPFTFTLPDDLPSCYEGENGEVQYFVKAILDIPFNYHEDKVPLHVISKVDLNALRKFLKLETINLESHTTSGCLWWTSTPIEMNVSLEKNAFVLGETIAMNIDVANDSHSHIETVLISLKRVVEYKNDGSRKIKFKPKELVREQYEPGIPAMEERNWVAYFKIPTNIDLYNLTLCQLLNECFILRVQIIIPKLHRELFVETKIIIGHIPLITNEEIRVRNARPEEICYLPPSPTHLMHNSSIMYQEPQQSYIPNLM